MISIRTARWLDRKLGKPVCFLLSLLGRSRHAQCPNIPSIKRIAVIKMWGMGSIILASAAIRNLKLHCPNARLCLITLKNNQGLYTQSEWIDEFVYFDLSSLGNAIRSGGRMVHWLWRNHPELIFDFEFASRFTAILSWLSFKSFTVGYVPADSGKRIYDKTVAYHESEHVSKLFLRSLEAVHFKIYSENLIPFQINPEDRKAVDLFLSAGPIENFIVLNPNASEMALERLWPLDQFAQLSMHFLEAHPSYMIVLIGSSGEKERSGALLKQVTSERIVSAAGMFSIAGTGYLLSRARAFVTNDSGPLHLATLSNTPTIGLFGPETPSLYGPIGKRQIALTSNEFCSPCMSIYNDKLIRCPRQCACMKNVSVEQVLKELEAMIRRYETVSNEAPYAS